MDTRLICLEVMSIIKKHHPYPVPTHRIFGEIDACRRSIQRQIKFLCESNLIERKPDYKVGLKLEVEMKKFDEIKVKMHLSIGIHNSCQEDEVYLSDWTNEDSWNEMNDTEKNEFIENCISDWAHNYIEIGGGIVE